MGRPVGSKNGRRPPGGYPEVDEELGGFLAGFIEGEACFSIVRQSRGFGYRCAMRLCSRADDAGLIHDLAAKTHIGTVRPVKAQRTSRPQMSWSVVAKADCLRLIEILDQYPLRGRKSRDFAIWRAAVNWWVGGDPAQRRPNGDWEPMGYLKERLHEAKRYNPDPLALLDDGPPGLTGDWPAYLAGLVSAEGSLSINESGPRTYVPRLRVNMRADDLPLLTELHGRAGVGRLYEYERSDDSGKPVAAWVTSSRSDLAALVRILDAHAPRGRKAREYQIWHRAVLAHRMGAGASGRTHNLRTLKRRLEQARVYPAGSARLVDS